MTSQSIELTALQSLSGDGARGFIFPEFMIGPIRITCVDRVKLIFSLWDHLVFGRLIIATTNPDSLYLGCPQLTIPHHHRNVHLPLVC